MRDQKELRVILRPLLLLRCSLKTKMTECSQTACMTQMSSGSGAVQGKLCAPFIHSYSSTVLFHYSLNKYLLRIYQMPITGNIVLNPQDKKINDKSFKGLKQHKQAPGLILAVPTETESLITSSCSVLVPAIGRLRKVLEAQAVNKAWWLAGLVGAYCPKEGDP